MSFWIKKRTQQEAETTGKNAENPADKKRLSVAKEKNARRIDNLRIPQRLPISLRALGTQTNYNFHTKDLSATGAFVVCEELNTHPFQSNSTILEATVQLTLPEQGIESLQPLHFLAKIARVVEVPGTGQNSQTGFGIRIIQIPVDQRQLLENFIGHYGSPEISSNSGPEHRNKISAEESPESEEKSASLPLVS